MKNKKNENLYAIANALVNNNQYEAKALSTRFKTDSLARYFRQRLGWSPSVAHSAAQFCRGNCDWEIYVSLRDAK